MNPLWLLKIFGFVSGIDFKKALGFIASYWKIFLIGVLAAIIWYQNVPETRWLFGAETIPALEADLVVVKKNLQTAIDGNKELSDAIDEYNARVEAYKQLEIKMRKDIDKLQGELDIARTTTNTEVDIILNDPTPQSCEKAIDYLRDAGKDLKW